MSPSRYYTTEQAVLSGILSAETARYMHNVLQCLGENCCIHHPSEHPLNEQPLVFRHDRSPLMERICDHGIGHPDPDSLEYISKMWPERGSEEGVHGCDGCCRKKEAVQLTAFDDKTNAIEVVRWIDSGLHYAHEWMSEEAIIKRAKEWNGENITIGQIIYEDEAILVMVMTRDDEAGNAAGAFLIYKPCIVERTKV